jgi:hypothetical protein
MCLLHTHAARQPSGGNSLIPSENDRSEDRRDESARLKCRQISISPRPQDLDRRVGRRNKRFADGRKFSQPVEAPAVPRISPSASKFSGASQSRAKAMKKVLIHGLALLAALAAALPVLAQAPSTPATPSMPPAASQHWLEPPPASEQAGSAPRMGHHGRYARRYAHRSWRYDRRGRSPADHVTNRLNRQELTGGMLVRARVSLPCAPTGRDLTRRPAIDVAPQLARR